MNNVSSRRKIKNTVKSWPPPSGWVTSPAGFGDPVSLNPTTAVIEEAVVRRDVIRLKVTDQGCSFTNAVEVLDSTDLTRVANALSSAKGKSLFDAGELDI